MLRLFLIDLLDSLDREIKMNEIRVRYKDLIQFEKDIICNGCGPKGGWIPVPDFIFTASCWHHDFQYWIGCNRLQRKKADLQFLKEMLIDANTFLDKADRIKYKKIAVTYYRAVRVFGPFCFHWAKRQRNRIDLNIAVAKAMREGTV